MTAWIIGAKRTAVSPKNGAFASRETYEMGVVVIKALLKEVALPPETVDYVILANALYGGGNPARLCALAAGIPQQKPSMTIDTQCCGGLDALHLASSLVQSGAHDVIIAGGIESFSHAPRRFKRSKSNAPDEEYQRPPFSPWPERDPDMLDAAALLASQMNITRHDQEQFARQSHASALSAKERIKNECAPFCAIEFDAFTREIKHDFPSRLPILTGDKEHGLTAFTTAVEADAAAMCLVVSDRFLNAHPALKEHALQIVGGLSVGSDPAMPALAPVDAVNETLKRYSLRIQSFDVLEMMEAFAVQAMACIQRCAFDLNKTNLGGGALARGHPISASGIINAVRLCNEMIVRPDARLGMATIAGAGGLGSTLVLSS